jgi:UDP-glucose 4-epimerase
MRVLVTGGGGYIGSHAVKQLRQAGHHVVVLDNFSRGHREAVPKDVPVEELDLVQTEAIANALSYHQIDCVMHFAALAYVGESVEAPLRYYENNTAGTISLLQAMKQANVQRMVFSSTCATYGEPEVVPITEQEKQSPINPYGWSKLFIERVLKDYAAANPDFAFAALRYFNVAGCASDGTLGEDHDPETHIIPVLLEVALGKRDTFYINGEDYDTADGTCIRDYIHVEDLVDAHITVMDALKAGDQRCYNLGIGEGKSVKQLLDAARQVTGKNIPAQVGPRRPGDPPMLYADPTLIQRELNWQAKIHDVHQMIETAWRWFQTHPDGYEKP